MGSGSSYYYNLLNKDEQRAYFAIMEGLKKLAKSFSVPRLEPASLSRIYSMVRMDHPEIFYSVTYKYRFYEHADNVEMIPEYIFPVNKMKQHIQAMEARVKKVAAGAEKLSDWDKLIYIHDFILENVTYDKLKKPYSHEIIGAMGNGVAVCEGISKAVKILCDKLGIWCILALSNANPEQGVKYRHAWNVVKIEGKYYHLDATFDNSLSKGGEKRYDYFALGDDGIFRDHQPLVWQVPKCDDNKNSYYIQKKLSFTKEEDVRKRSIQAAKKNKALVFNWRGGYLTREKVKEFFDIMKEEAAKKEKTPIVRINWGQAVIEAKFIPSEEGEEDILYQQANEGELYDGEVN